MSTTGLVDWYLIEEYEEGPRSQRGFSHAGKWLLARWSGGWLV